MPPKCNYYEGETFLLNLLTYFSYFSFDKAKEQADREKDASKHHASPIWITLLTCISQLASVEKLYMNLTFLTPKGFLRKESSVRLTYETILTELVEIEKRKVNNPSLVSTPSSSSQNNGNISVDKNEKGCSDGVLIHISSHLILFIQARLLMLSFYEKLIVCSASNYVNYEEIRRYIDEIMNKNSNSFHHPVLAPIKTAFTYESEITSHLLGSLMAMQKYQFLPSLLHLHDAHSKLLSWHSLIQSKESKKYTFGSSFLKSPSLPALYQWLSSAKSSFVSKFSLYFHEILSQQAPHCDMRSLMAKLSCDYVSKIQNLQRKIDAHSVSIILKATDLSSLKTPGYCYPSETEIGSSVIESFHSIFSYPVKPIEYWSKIAFQISDIKNEESYEKVTMTHHPKVGTTFFFCQIEPNFYIVVVFENRKPEKHNFIKELIFNLTLQLRCTKDFANLKPN